jgi:serine/threonine-protein kinase
MKEVMAGMPPEAFPPAPPPFGTTSPPPTTKVPNVVGMSQGQATSTLSAAGFGVAVQMIKDLAPKGTVLSQNPAGGSKGIPGSVVTIQVSTGVARLNKIPNVVGMKQADATAALEQLGFVVAVVTAPDPLNKGLVILQSPTANSRAQQGTTVTITVGV